MNLTENRDTKLNVLIIDPCFDDRGLTNPVIPLSIGLIGSYLLNNVSNVQLKLMKSASLIVKYLEKEKPDVLGITNYLWNTNLGIKISHIARAINPRILLIFGGPEISRKSIEFNKYLKKKYAHVDLLIEHEGEVAFTQAIKCHINNNYNRNKIRNCLEEIGNAFYIDSERGIISGPKIPRISNLDIIPSPYVNGLFDGFLEDKVFQPLIQTNRGCPYQCTFCHEGDSYFRKINGHSLEYVKQELDYIAARVEPSLGLQIVDSNWGMFPQDEIIAKHIRHLQDTVDWPLSIESNTGKSQLERIKKVAETLNGALMINNSVQSMNDDVLSIIKRKNLKGLTDFVESLDIIQQPEFILPLPGETKESFLNGIHTLLDAGSLIRLQVHPTMLLNNTEMYTPQIVEKYHLKSVFRQHSNLIRTFGEDLVCESEKIVISTSTMTASEVIDCRIYSMLLDALLRNNPIKEVFLYLEQEGIKKSIFTTKLMDSIPLASINIQKSIHEFKSSLGEGNFPSEEELFSYMREHIEQYATGEKGGSHLKYSMKLWIEHTDEMLDWVFKTLSSLFSYNNSNNNMNEIYNLEQYMRGLYQDQCNRPISTSEFDYDIFSWSKTKETINLNNFKKNIKYNFVATEISKIDKMKIWKSFGFLLDNNDMGALVNESRLYIYKLRRNVKNLPHNVGSTRKYSELNTTS